MKNNNNKLILCTIGLVMLMELFDGSALNTALPQIAFDIHVNPINLKMAITVYLLTLGMFIPAAAWMADKYGAKKVLFVSIIGFLLSSIACGCSTSLISLVVFRALQGAFAAFTMPIARLILVRVFQGNIVNAMSTMAMIVLIGPALGVVFGGFITTFVSWRLIFFLNVPIGITVLIIIKRFFPRLETCKVGKFDVVGFLILSSALFIALLAMDMVIDNSLGIHIKLIVFLISLVLFVVYYFYSGNRANSIIDIGIFKNRLFSYFILVNLIIRLFITGMFFLFPLYMQTQLGYSAAMSGLILLPSLAGSWLAKMGVRKLLSLLHYRTFMLLLFVGMGIVLLLTAITFLHYSNIIFIILLVFFGWFMGNMATVCNSATYKTLTPQDISTGTVINSMVIQLSGSFSIAIMATILVLTSGISNMQWHTILPKSSFCWVMVTSTIFMFILVFIAWCAPVGLRKVSTD